MGSIAMKEDELGLSYGLTRHCEIDNLVKLQVINDMNLLGLL